MTSEMRITPREVSERLQRGEKLTLVDVRQHWERQVCRIEGSKHIPLDALPACLDEFDEGAEVVVYCHHGIRSLDATAWLRQHGVNARSLDGGIERWALEIDPKIPRY